MIKLPRAPRPTTALLFPSERPPQSCSHVEQWLAWSKRPQVDVHDIVQYDSDLNMYTSVLHKLVARANSHARVTLYNCRSRLQRARAVFIGEVVARFVKLTADATANHFRDVTPRLIGELLTYAWHARGFVLGTWLYAISPAVATDPSCCVGAARTLSDHQREILYREITDIVQHKECV